jgi:hypothetical protein
MKEKDFVKNYGQESVLNGHHLQVEDHIQNKFKL